MSITQNIRTEQIVRMTCSISFDKPEQYSKCELTDAQENLKPLITYAVLTDNEELLEVCYKLACEYRIEKGYAQKKYEFCLAEAQNTHESIKRIIDGMKAAKVVLQ